MVGSVCVCVRVCVCELNFILQRSYQKDAKNPHHNKGEMTKRRAMTYTCTHVVNT